MVQLPAHLISNQAQSTTLATFRTKYMIKTSFTFGRQTFKIGKEKRRSGKYRIRTYGTASRSLDFESSPIDHSGNFPLFIKRTNFVAHEGFEPSIFRMRI